MPKGDLSHRGRTIERISERERLVEANNTASPNVVIMAMCILACLKLIRGSPQSFRLLWSGRIYYGGFGVVVRDGLS